MTYRKPSKAVSTICSPGSAGSSSLVSRGGAITLPNTRKGKGSTGCPVAARSTCTWPLQAGGRDRRAGGRGLLGS